MTIMITIPSIGVIEEYNGPIPAFGDIVEVDGNLCKITKGEVVGDDCNFEADLLCAESTEGMEDHEKFIWLAYVVEHNLPIRAYGNNIVKSPPSKLFKWHDIASMEDHTLANFILYTWRLVHAKI